MTQSGPKSLVWVTGAAGAVGSAMVARLLAGGTRVAGIGLNEPDWNPPEGLTYISDFINDASLCKLAEMTGTPSSIIHLAGGAQVAPSFADPAGDFDKTVTSTISVLDWVRRNAPACHIVYASSAAIYGTACAGPISETRPAAPISPYGFHKLLAEQAIGYWGRQFGLKSAIVRLFSVYGPALRKQLIFELSKKLDAGASQLMLGGTGDEIRDWLWIDDAAALLDQVIAHCSTEVPVFNGGTGKATPLREICQLIVGAHGDSAGLAFDGEVRQGDPFSLLADVTKASAIGFTPQVLPETGVPATVQAYHLSNMGAGQS